MTAQRLYRAASGLLLLFAAGHTVGFLRFRPPTPEAAAVRDAMNAVAFRVGSQSFSYGGFYVGFGLFATAYLLFAAFLAWQLARLSASHPQAIGGLGWGFFTLQVVGLALSAIFFSTAPAIFSALVAACTGGAAWRVQTG